MASTVIVPDNRGRVLLGKVTTDIAGHYLAAIDEHGVITLVPAVVRPKMVEDILADDPTLLDRIRDHVSSGEAGLPSELWDQIKSERTPGESTQGSAS